jgi:hypothetical protein
VCLGVKVLSITRHQRADILDRSAQPLQSLMPWRVAGIGAVGKVSRLVESLQHLLLAHRQLPAGHLPLAMRQALAHGRPKPTPAPRKKAVKKYKVIR